MDVVPIAGLMRDVAANYLRGDLKRVAELLDAPTAELSERERPLKPLMEWLLRGRSPGRADTTETTYADDLVLSFMAVTLLRLARDEKVTIAAGLALAADVVRDTVQGQFISSVQGASAMQRLRETRPEHWKQRKSLNRICARLWAQAKPQLDADAERPTPQLQMRGGKKVLQVLDQSGELRRLEMRAPDPIDWEVMSLCWRDETSSETSPHRSLWLGFASLFLAAAQRVGGWFEFASTRTGRKGHTRTTKFLVLSERAREAIEKDVERWTSLGFHAQPMLVPPEGNDYLTVKHRPVTGQRPPKGLLTNPSGTLAWDIGAAALANSPWNINVHTLALLDAHPEMWHPENPSEAIRVAEHKRLAMDTFYLPTTMDFRGRIYYRTPWVSPQSGDLGKSLLCFPYRAEDEDKVWPDELAMHLAGLYGGPNKLDKAPLDDRHEWLRTFDGDVTGADKPLTLSAAWALVEAGQANCIPVQLDGTCNGLQHLSALTRDEVGAAQVNLMPSTLEEPPKDIYGSVANTVELRIADLVISPEPDDWIVRLTLAGLKINRKLTKGPVMVLPYGGTREAVRLAVKASVLEQLHALEGLGPWQDVAGYEAFRERELHDHPLFNQDIAQLGNLVWDCIVPAIPRAMAFMQALQEIGSWVGERAIAWRVGAGPGSSGLVERTTGSTTFTEPLNGSETSMQDEPPSTGQPLWVIQAKSKASRKQVTMRGFHLPDMVRRLTLMANLNEVDPKAHRTGIVANFIHSLDAAHLAASVSTFVAKGGSCVGSVHDCLLVRPSEAALMGRCLREEFAKLHNFHDPLRQPVRIGELPTTTGVNGGVDEVAWKEYPDWYALAAEAGVTIPERGDYMVSDVLESAWFFS